MTEELVIRCDACNQRCGERYFQLESVIKWPTMSDDTETKHFCNKQCLNVWSESSAPSN